MDSSNISQNLNLLLPHFFPGNALLIWHKADMYLVNVIQDVNWTKNNDQMAFSIGGKIYMLKKWTSNLEI